MSTLLEGSWTKQDDPATARMQREDAWDSPACRVAAHDAVEEVTQEVRAAIPVDVAVDGHGALETTAAALDGQVALGEVADGREEGVVAADVVLDVGGHALLSSAEENVAGTIAI